MRNSLSASHKPWMLRSVAVAAFTGACMSGAVVNETGMAAETHAPPQPAPRASSGTERTQPVQPLPAPGTELADLITRGATMEEVARLRDPIAKDPNEAVYALKAGNARFYGGSARRPEMSANERRAQILSQTPFAVILGCSDSRVPTEIVYDQSLGSLFVVRVAGNIVEPATVGSIQYAIQHLKSHVVVVMGHEGCGAVAAAMLTPQQQRAEPENVRFLLDRIAPAVSSLPVMRDPKARMREAVISNVRLQVHRLKQDPTVAANIRSGNIRVIGAFYEIGSGAVDFLETDEELRLSPAELRGAAVGTRLPTSSTAARPGGALPDGVLPGGATSTDTHTHSGADHAGH